MRGCKGHSISTPALAGDGVHLLLFLSADLYLTAAGETRMFLGVSQPCGSSAFGLGQFIEETLPG